MRFRWRAPPVLPATRDLREHLGRAVILRDKVRATAAAVDATSLAAYGLGAELRPSVEERARALRSFGIDPTDPHRISKLRELERRAVGERAATALGVAFLKSTPDGFCNRPLISEDS